jgi:cytochrome c biogenesis protein
MAAAAARLSLRSRWGHFWHEYTRMRTAIFFLIGVVAIVVIGAFVPQVNTSNPTSVQNFLTDHANLEALFAHLGLPLDDVFESPVFFVLLGSLYIALGWCVIRRGQALVVRTVKRYPRSPQYWGEWGSWIFHSAFFLLVVAVVWGKATGYQGLVAVTEGQSFTNSPAGYDTLQTGLLFNGQFANFTLDLKKFTVQYASNGEASLYDSRVDVYDGSRYVESKDIQVNDFLSVDGINVYQQDYGFAPQIVVRNPQGQTVFNAPVQLFGDDKTQQTGVLKVPDFDYTIPGGTKPVQLGARLALFPDAKLIPAVNSSGAIDPTQTSYGPGGQNPDNPVMDVQLFMGDLGLNSGQPQNVNELDTDAMQPYFADGHVLPLSLGQTLTLDLPGANNAQLPFTITFTALHQYSLFQVSKDSGVLLVYTTFFLVMFGLLTKLYLKPFMERRERRRKRGPLRLDPLWSEHTRGEPVEDAAEEERTPAAV